MNIFSRIWHFIYKPDMIKSLLRYLIFLSAISLFLSLYLTYTHYHQEASLFCNINDEINCDKVNQSVYATILGLPVALLGVFNALMLIFCFMGLLYDFDFKKIDPLLSRKVIIWFLLIQTSASFSFSVYLSYLELFVIHAICLFCAIHQVIMVGIFGIYLAIFGKLNKD